MDPTQGIRGKQEVQPGIRSADDGCDARTLKEPAGKIKRQRFKDGLSYQETQLVLKENVEISREVTSNDTDAAPAIDTVAEE